MGYTTVALVWYPPNPLCGHARCVTTGRRRNVDIFRGVLSSVVDSIDVAVQSWWDTTPAAHHRRICERGTWNILFLVRKRREVLY